MVPTVCYFHSSHPPCLEPPQEEIGGPPTHPANRAAGTNIRHSLTAFSYCGDHQDKGIYYIQGTGGKLANMDIDCDGQWGGPADDGRCANDGSHLPITAFQWILEGYNAGITEFNPYVHPYVVFGNFGDADGYTTFDPQTLGIKPLSVMAVVCNNKLVSQLNPRYMSFPFDNH